MKQVINGMSHHNLQATVGHPISYFVHKWSVPSLTQVINEDMKQNVKQMFAILHSIIPVYATSLVDLQAALADFLMHETSHSIHSVCA